jgi:hypothetical protein
MLTFRVEVEYGNENRRFDLQIISDTPEKAAEAATHFIRTKIRGSNESTPVHIINITEVIY